MICLVNVLKMSSRRLQGVFKTSSRRLEDVLKTNISSWLRRLRNVLKTSSEDVWLKRIYSPWSRRLEDIFWRRRGKTSSSRWMFAGGDVWVIFSHLCFKKTLNASVIYYFYIQHVAKEYCCLGSHWVVFTKTFHAALILASSNLILCAIVRNHSNFRKYWFHAKHSFKRSIETRFK